VVEKVNQMMENDWIRLKSESGPDIVLFKTRFDLMKNPRNGNEFKAVVLESPDWVDVVALTPQKKIVVVCQYRFGIGRNTVEIPAGIIEPGETHDQAVKRELREETGYTAKSWKYLGWVETNPAFMNNICHQWLALDAVKTSEVDLDLSENIVIDEYTIDEVCKAIKLERMRNSFTLLALSRVFDLRDAAS
jgi:8-oxo-dGTP pyrophosphatase MutT (NUDIX family)